MAFVLVRHKVKDYLQWKFAFVEHAIARKVTGSQGGQLFRNQDDPAEVLILMEWDSLDNARRFVGSQDLKEAMERAGAIVPADIVFLEKVETPSW